MKSAADCIAEARAATGRDATDDELEAIFAELHARAQKRMAGGQDAAGAARDAGAELARETRLAALIEKRNRAINVIRRQGLDARTIEGKEAESVKALVSGVRGTDRNAALSIDAQAHALVGERLGELVGDLEREGLLKPFRKANPDLDRDITRELWRLDDPAAGKATGNKIATDIARILNKHLEIVRAMENDAGAWIGKLDHYAGRQSHDMDKIRGGGGNSPEAREAAYFAWRDFIVPRLDPRTFEHLKDPAEAETFLKATWNALASGLHESATGGEWLGGFKGPGNLAKKLSQERKLHFKDADAFYEYNAKFGRGNVRDSIAMSIEHGARNTAIMRVLGTNPEALFTAWVDGLAKKANDRSDFKTVAALTSPRDKQVLDYVIRKTSAIEHNTLARVGMAVRQSMDLAMLGGAGVSSITDAAAVAGMLRHAGVPLWKGYVDYFRALLLPNSPARRDIVRAVGVGISGMQGDIASRMHAVDAPLGGMSKQVNTFHKLTGLDYITNAGKEGAGLGLSNRLASVTDREFGALDRRLQNDLRRYGIEAPEWDAIRKTEKRAADGNDYLLPAEVETLPDAAVAHLGKEGANLNRIRADLRGKLATFYVDQIREGLSEPTAAQRVATTFGTTGGTWAGEITRSVMQFKSFTVGFMSRSLGRELRRDGVDVMGVAHLIVMTTILGLAALTTKELLRGRNARWPETASDWAKLGAAAMVQGGGLGIYGDFLFGEANRSGGGLLGSLAGPTIGTIDDLQKLVASLRTGTGHPAAEGFQLLKNHAPFVNLFYARAALDYFIFYRLQEALNPGYLRRYEQKVKKDNAQTFWLRPTSAVH